MTYRRAGTAFALAMILAFPLALAACGGGGGSYVTTPHQHWAYEHVGEYLVLQGGNIFHANCAVLQENVSKEKHSSRSKHDPDYTEWTAVLTSKSEHYPANAGDKFCNVYKRNGTFVQMKENEFIVQASLSGRVKIDYAFLETEILYNAAAVGRLGNFKYGVFDNIEERTQEAESQVTGSTTRTTGSATGVVTPVYQSTLGVRYGNEKHTTTVNRTPSSITVDRKHSVRYYNSKPDTDGYFNVDLVLKSYDGENLKVTDSDVPNAKYCWEKHEECGTFDSNRKDFTHYER